MKDYRVFMFSIKSLKRFWQPKSNKRLSLFIVLLLFIVTAGCQRKASYLASTKQVSSKPADLIVYEAQQRLWLTDSQGSFKQALTSKKIVATQPSWSRDKKKIAFLYGNQKRLAFLDLTTRKVQLAKTEDNVALANLSGPIAWFPDNQKVAYVQNELNGSQTIYYYHLKFRRPVVFWTKEFDITSELNPAISHDGKLTAFIWGYENETGFVQELWRLDTLSGQDLVKILALAGQVQSVDWSPTGEKLAFAIKEPVPGSAALTTNIYWQNKDATGRELLRRQAENPHFDSSGKRLLYQRGGQLWVMQFKDKQSKVVPNVKGVATADW
jgi:Tol biopolymer transport system component